MDKSFYMLELSVAPGGAHRHEVLVYNRPEHIRRCLEQEFLSANRDAREGAAYLAVWYGETIQLTVVDRGQTLDVIDLRPHIRVRFGERPLLALSESTHYKETWPGDGAEPHDEEAMFELDWSAIAAALVDLRPPLLQSGEDLVFDGEELRYGHNDLDAGDDPPADWIDPDPAA